MQSHERKDGREAFLSKKSIVFIDAEDPHDHSFSYDPHHRLVNPLKLVNDYNVERYPHSRLCDLKEIREGNYDLLLLFSRSAVTTGLSLWILRQADVKTPTVLLTTEDPDRVKDEFISPGSSVVDVIQVSRLGSIDPAKFREKIGEVLQRGRGGENG